MRVGIYDRTLENTGRGLEYRRRSKGLSKVQVAELAGISRNDVAHIESGAGGVSWRKVLPYLEALDVELPLAIMAKDPGLFEGD